MSTGVAPCRHCGRHVSVTAGQCRFCGYDADPERNERARIVWAVSGLVALLSVVAAPLGLAMLWKARHHHRAAVGGVVEAAHPSTPFAAWLLADCRRALASITGSPRRRR